MIAQTTPAVVLAAFLRHPVRFPDGRALYALITQQGRFFSAAAPDCFDAAGTPITLSGELGAGSIVRIALANGLIHAVQVVHARYIDPFGGPS